MGKRNRFIDRDMFGSYIARIQKKGGGQYEQDAIDGMHGDLSRFIVRLLATRSPSELRQLYTDLGWSDNMWADALHRAANEWMKENQ